MTVTFKLNDAIAAVTRNINITRKRARSLAKRESRVTQVLKKTGVTNTSCKTSSMFVSVALMNLLSKEKVKSC